MKFGKKQVVLISVIFIVASNACEKSNECVEKNRLNPKFSDTVPETILYQNDSLKLSIPAYFSPDGDGYFDVFGVYLFKKDNEGVICDSKYFTEFDLVISDKCKETFKSSNSKMPWNGSTSNYTEGIYYLKLFAVLYTTDTLDVSMTFELHNLR